jgi:hypothetical protein
MFRRQHVTTMNTAMSLILRPQKNTRHVNCLDTGVMFVWLRVVKFISCRVLLSVVKTTRVVKVGCATFLCESEMYCCGSP